MKSAQTGDCTVNYGRLPMLFKLNGDFVQCGVETGYTARAIIEYVKFYKNLDKTLSYLIHMKVYEDRVPDEPAAFWNQNIQMFMILFVKSLASLKMFKLLRVLFQIVCRP